MTLAAVGEKHSLALQSWCSAPVCMRARLAPAQSLSSRPMSGLSDRDSNADLAEALSGPIDSLEALLTAEARPHSDTTAYWRSLEAVPGPGSRQVPTTLTTQPLPHATTCATSCGLCAGKLTERQLKCVTPVQTYT